MAYLLGNDSVEAMLEFLDEFPDQLFNKLYDEFTKMVEEVSAKYSVKNEADFDGVVEDIKK